MGVLGYLEQPESLVAQLCQCAASGGLVSIMTGNANAMAVRPALERRWDDALASFDARTEIGVLGVRARADTVEELSDLLQSYGVEPVRWYGVWLFVDWFEFSGAELDPSDDSQQVSTLSWPRPANVTSVGSRCALVSRWVIVSWRPSQDSR